MSSVVIHGCYNPNDVVRFSKTFNNLKSFYSESDFNALYSNFLGISVEDFLVMPLEAVMLLTYFKAEQGSLSLFPS